MKNIRLHELTFSPYITAEEIRKCVDQLASRIESDYADKNPVLIIILNGAFVFAADLVRQINIPIRLDFAKVSSYKGIASTQHMNEHFLWQTDLAQQHVIIVEDIVDTGHTLHYLQDRIRQENPASLEITCLLFKPAAFQYTTPPMYAGISIPNDFVVGYGLDYNGLGRDLAGIYKKTDA